MSRILGEGHDKRLKELDGWRAVSVLLVMLHHIGFYQHSHLLPHFPSLLRLFYYCGPLGVMTFFVISGFLICRLLISEESRYGSISLKAFYYRRVFRILPPLYLYLGTVLLLLSFGLIRESGKAVLGAALFLYDLHIPPPTWFLGHTWSLAIEEQFYIIFPAMWVFTPKPRKNAIFCGVFFLCVASNLFKVHAGSNELIYSGTRVGFACISCGVLMAIHEERARSIAMSIPAFIVALIGLALLFHPGDSYSWQRALYEALVVPSAIGLVLLFSLERGSWLRGILRSRPMQAVGLASYGIYLWQQLFTAPETYFSGAGKIIPLFLPLLFLIVPLSYFLIEKPAMRYGKLLSKRTRESSIRITTSI